MNTPSIIAYGCLGIGLGGVLWRLGRWFWIPVGPEGCGRPLGAVLRQTGAAIGRTLFSRKIVALARTIIWEILLQGHVLKQDWRRGVTHLALCYGVLFLVVFHALDDFTSTRLWADYVPTLNPWRSLRNLGGVLIILGAVMAARRRQSAPLLRRTRTAADRLVLILLAAMVLTGFMLEGSQIVSPAIFDTMVADYLIGVDDQEIAALQAYWQAEFGAAARPLSSAADAAMLARGRGLHHDFCADCHDRPRSAFVSYPLSMLLRPVANTLEGAGFITILWHVHFLTACLGLALLPFTKFVHLVATPVSLLVRAAGPAVASPAGLRPVRRAMAFDACTHCGICSQHCAVTVIYRAAPNPAILPAEKLGASGRWASGDRNHAQGAALAEGSFVCTACGRCTTWCPSGIDLQDLWQALRDDLVRQGFPPVHGWIRSRRAAQWAASLSAATPAASEPPVKLGISETPETFWACVQCTTCTSVCPVVAVSEDPRRDLDLTPHHVKKLINLQLRELALGARMVWDCVTCYQCQEHCPQGVQVADIFYELRNEAHRRLQPEFPLRPGDASIPEA